MAKRFTDTNKWDHSWVRKLSPIIKCALFYINDKCDHAGIWVADFEAMSFNVGGTITQEQFESAFGDKLTKFGDDKYFIPSFIDFQYGYLNPENKVHRSVLERLEKVAPNKPLDSPLKWAKDKEKEKDKAKDQEKDKEKECFDFENIYKIYPRKLGKAKGIKTLQKLITTQEQYESFSKAVSNYAQDCRLNATPENYIKHFSSFVGTRENQTWLDYVDFNPTVRNQNTFNKADQRTANNRAAAQEYLKSLEEEK